MPDKIHLCRVESQRCPHVWRALLQIGKGPPSVFLFIGDVEFCNSRPQKITRRESSEGKEKNGEHYDGTDG